VAHTAARLRAQKPVEILASHRSGGRHRSCSTGLQEGPMKTILVVDDDPGVRALLHRLVESLGYDVLSAGSAADALEVLARRSVDLALCDVLMPGHDGVWLTEQILARHPGTLVALATGLQEMDPTVTLRPGVVGYIVKPFRRAAVAQLLQAAFEDPAIRPKAAGLDLAVLEAF
jgi:CheY-like chemotaxis protein